MNEVTVNRKWTWVRPLAGGCAVACLLVLAGGCGTTKLQRATQQMVLSDAVDRAVSQIDFAPLAGRKVFMDTSYIRQVKGLDFVNAPYIISSLRHRLTLAGGLLVDNKAEAEIVVEPRVGALGYDGHDVTYGIPPSRLMSTAAMLVPNAPQLPPIPEMAVAKRSDEVAIAKLNIFAYERATGSPVRDWKTAVAKSTARDTWVLGAGPFQSGSIYSNPMFVGQELHLPRIPRDSPLSPAGLARLISHEEPDDHEGQAEEKHGSTRESDSETEEGTKASVTDAPPESEKADPQEKPAANKPPEKRPPSEKPAESKPPATKPAAGDQQPPLAKPAASQAANK